MAEQTLKEVFDTVTDRFAEGYTGLLIVQYNHETLDMVRLAISNLTREEQIALLRSVIDSLEASDAFRAGQAGQSDRPRP